MQSSAQTRERALKLLSPPREFIERRTGTWLVNTELGITVANFQIYRYDTIRYAIFFPQSANDHRWELWFYSPLFFFVSSSFFSLFFFFDRFLIEGVLFFFLFFLEIGFHIINRRSMRFVSILFFLFLFEINNFLRRSWMYWMLRILRFPPSKRYNHLRRIDTNSKSIFISWSVRFVYLLFERNFSFYLSN